MNVKIGIKSINDFFIEFTGTSESSSEALIAIDDIELNPIEHCQGNF
jgi:hypothetical protein